MNKHVTVPKAKGKARQADRVKAIRAEADAAGLLGEKTARIGVRVNPALIEEAMKQTGIASPSELVEYALACIALDDAFVVAFINSRGKVDPDLHLGY